MMERIGRYEILGELGRGSMGAVFRARDPQIGRTVAIKIILTANLPVEDLQQYQQRFQREAQAAGQMSHPGIVTIHDIAEDEAGQPYLVMEFIEGTPLDKFLAPGAERLSLGRSLEIATQVAEALDYAHRRGVIHRDIKPANILLTADGRAKIADFGIAKLAGTQLTQAGQLMGTPAFMSPEQFSGAAVDARTDLFSLGAMLYWMCTGEKPFAGDTLTAVSFKIVYTAPIPARQLNPAVPAELDAVLSRCLAKNPDDRYPGCRELAADLEALKAGRPVSAPPPPPPMERTLAGGPGRVAAAPVSEAAAGPGARVEKTIAQPPRPTETVASARLAEATTRAIPGVGVPTVRAGALGRLRERKKLVAAVGAALLLLLLLAGYAFWPGEEPQPAVKTEPPPEPAPTPPAPTTTAPEPSRSGPPPWAKAGGRRRSEESAPERQTRAAANSTLEVDCRHNFRKATLTILSDGRPLLATTLRGQEQDLRVAKIYQGSLFTSKRIPAGRHVLRVQVSSREDNYEEEQEIGGTFREGAVRTLLIEFGKGSAFGVVERKLTLSWR